jgi:outer membrane protein, heavy metal efflux system
MSDVVRGLAALLCTALLSACAAPSRATDLQRVRQLSSATELGLQRSVDPSPAAEVRELLAIPLDGDRAVQVALLNNRGLRAMLREVGVARGRLLQAGLLPNPVFEVEALPERQTAVELRVEYAVTRAALLPLRSQVARSELEAARLRAASTVLETGFAVRAALFSVQAAQQRLAIGEETLQAFAASRDAARALVAAGNVPALDLASHKAAFERARVEVAELELEVAARREALSRLLGLHGEDTDWTTAGALPPVPERPSLDPDMEARAVEQSLELRELESRLDALGQRTRLTRVRGLVPDVSVDVHALYGAPGFAPADDPWLFGAGVRFTLPVLDREQGRLVEEEAQFDSLLERYYGLAVFVRSAARDMSNHIRSAHGRAWHYQETVLPSLGEVTRQTLLQYNAMQVGVFQLLEARRAELEAQLRYVETLREYWSAAAASEVLRAGRRVRLSGGAPSDVLWDPAEEPWRR